ncbi:MAG TPA: hypothetical protein VD793_01575, partial [Gemmatimonadales bacterium]|nr:hypothetical protein [Gemmatimonadales bacterium]
MTSPARSAALSWPPPALAEIHGKLWPTIALLGLADLVLVLPLLASLGIRRPLGSLGPFGEAYWVPLSATVIGGMALLGGLWRLARLLWNARGAARAGHGWGTVLAVTADEPRDTGFLLTGQRAYAALQPAARDTVITARLFAAASSLAAVLWMPGALSLSIVLGRLGAATERFLWTSTFWIPLALGVGGLLGAMAARVLTRGARRAAPAPPAAPDGDALRQVTEWNQALKAQRGDLPAMIGRDTWPKGFGLAAVGTVLLALLVAVPVSLLTLAGTIGSVIASIATPAFGGAQARLAAVEVLRRYGLDPDPAITEQAAGEALHVLLSVGRSEAERPAAERPPVRVHAEPWWSAGGMGEKFEQGEWIDSLFARRPAGSPEAVFLRQVAAHPGHAEFATVARARSADVIATRYQIPFDTSVTVVNLPIPRFTSIRQGARAHLARAAAELGQGRRAEAERTIREVISVGFRLLDDGPTLM